MVEVHGGLLFWSVITFLLLLVVLKKVAWGPIISALESREKEIKNVFLITPAPSRFKSFSNF